MIRKFLHWVMALVMALLSIFLTPGCRSSKVTTQGPASTDDTPAAGVNTPVARFNALVDSWKPWKDVEVNAKVQITSPAKLNGAGKVYMKRGEWILVSVRMLGFEVANLWVDNDSIIAVDKFHKKYMSESISQLFGVSGVTVADIQDLLMGRAFLTGSGTVTAADRGKFDISDAANGWYLLPRQQPERFTYGFLVSLTANELRGAAIDVDGFGSVAANYSGYFESRTCGWFAREVSVENSRGKKVAATLKWDLNGAKFNAGLTKSCNIPEGYERISAAALSSLLKSF